MLIDDVTVKLEAGGGGKGAVAFSKVKLALGPTGGDGGHGASIYFEGIRDINGLLFFASRQIIRAERGRDGRGKFLDGRRGEDMILKVPTGTTVTNTQTGFAREISEPGQRILAVGGGMGGRGNFKFRSAINTTPMQAEEGSDGDMGEFKLELRLIADVGFVGLPNAGKSSLLNELTNAKSKVANYAFTTLEPHLGAYYGLILADIPGLIEGASEGKGLGVKFLKHIERTKTLFHLVSAESEDPIKDYKIVRKELESFNKDLTKKDEFILITKSDMVSAEQMQDIVKTFKKGKKTVLPMSILDENSMTEVKKILNAMNSVATA